jgi:dihydropteroate synthase
VAPVPPTHAPQRPRILAVVNASPESFSTSSFEIPDAATAAARLVAEGADVVDIGAQSLRTDQAELSVQEEIDRLLPVLTAVRAELPDVPISVDTYRSEVAAAALELGIQVVNDPSGLHDEAMGDLVASSEVDLVVAFNPGRPKVRRPRGERVDDPVGTCTAFFADRIERLAARGVRREQLLLDPGPDLYKPPDQTITLLRQMPGIRDALGVDRVLWAVSRKDFIGALLGALPRERGAGTLGALAALDLAAGDLVRVHDVRATADFLAVRHAVWSGVDAGLELRDDLRYDA